MDPVEGSRRSRGFHRTDGVMAVEAELWSGDFYKNTSMDPVEHGRRSNEVRRTE